MATHDFPVTDSNDSNDISGTPSAGNYARWSDADTLEARTTAQVLSDIGAQASDTDLTAIAALTSAADKVPYATGAGTWALADLTAAGRALIDDADAAAQLVTLGVAAAVTATKLDDLATPDDNTDLNATSARHGLLPKLSNVATEYLTGQGAWATPAGGGPDISGTPNAGEYARFADADTLEARTTAQVLSDIGAQASDTDLTAIAALISAADKVPYATGAGTWALADLTAAGRALIDDADAAAQLVTLGVAAAITGTKLDDLTAPDDNTDLNASSTRHGLLPKLSNVATEYLTGTGTWATPAGGYSEGCSVYKNANQSISAQTWTAVSWPAEVFDSGTMHNNSTNNSRITIPTTGKYLFTAVVGRCDTIDTVFVLKWYVNGTKRESGGVAAKYYHAEYNTVNVATILSLTAGDYVELYVMSNSAADIVYDVNTTAATYYQNAVSNLSCVRVG